MEPITPEVSTELQEEAFKEFEATHPEVDTKIDIHKAQLQATYVKTTLSIWTILETFMYCLDLFGAFSKVHINHNRKNSIVAGHEVPKAGWCARAC